MSMVRSIELNTTSIGVVGLGYVGLPLAMALQRRFSLCAYDRDKRRIDELHNGTDHTRSANKEDLRAARESFTSDASLLKNCPFVIIAVPTPVTESCKPDLRPLQSAAQTVGRYLMRGAVVVIESTVFPGVTEDVLGPILAHESGMRCGIDFFLGYSPERVNPGDQDHSLETIPKVIAGQNEAATDLMEKVYGAIVHDVHRSANIKTAEAAKLLENTQRDVNIALVNEAAMIFHQLGVDTQEVLRTAGTKWNFARFYPGLVGGHCIATDPYYLIHVAQENGHTPSLVLAGRQVNNSISRYVAEQTAKMIESQNVSLDQARVLILGFTFKEDVPDTRNTRVADIVNVLIERGLHCALFDSEADAEDVRSTYGFELIENVEQDAPYNAIIAAVKHRSFETLFPVKTLRALTIPARGFLVDVKSIYDPAEVEAAGIAYWRL